jgi:hypothetical protein
VAVKDEYERARFLSLFMDELLIAVLRLKENRESLEEALSKGTTETEDGQ